MSMPSPMKSYAVPGPHGWLWLFVSPVDYFKNYGGVVHPALLIALVGLGSALDQTETSALVSTQATRIDNWTLLWSACLVSAPIWGVLNYFVGGWWTRVRASFCGDPDMPAKTARRVSITASTIFASATIVSFLAISFLFERPADYFASEEFWISPLIFGVWSSYAQYVIVCDREKVRRGAARFWFLGLPLGVFGLVAVGTIVYAFLGGN